MSRITHHVDYRWVPEFRIILMATTSAGKIQLSWLSSLAATRYDLYRDGVLYLTNAGLSVDDTNVTADVSYTYFIHGILEVQQDQFISVRTAQSNSEVVVALPQSPSGTGLEVWFSAELGRTMNGNKVTTWVDQVSGHTFTQATDALRPVYDATSESMQFTEADATAMRTTGVVTDVIRPHTVVICLRRGANPTVFPNSTVRYLIRDDTGVSFSKYSYVGTPTFMDGTQETSTIPIDSNYHTMMVTIDGSKNHRFYSDGILVSSNDAAVINSGMTGHFWSLGGTQNGGAGNFWLKHIQVYDRVYDANEVLALHNQLITAPPLLPAILTTSMPVGLADAAYSKQLTASGDGTITWDVSSGALPTGVTMSAGGLVSGTPTVSGTFNFTARATSEHGEDTQDLPLIIQAAQSENRPVFIGPDISAQSWYLSTAITPLDVSALFTGETSYSLVGDFPAGVSINGSGVISGTPTEEHGNPYCYVKATNAEGDQLSNFFAVTVVDATPELVNLVLNSRHAMARKTSEGQRVPWGWDSTGIGATYITDVIYDPATQGAAVELTVPGGGGGRWRSGDTQAIACEINQRYTFCLTLEVDAASATAVSPGFLIYSTGPGYAIHFQDKSVAIGQTKRIYVVFSFSGGSTGGRVQLVCEVLPSVAQGTAKVRISNPMMVKGDFHSALPEYVPTGPTFDGTYWTPQDTGTTGRVATTKDFGWGGLHWGATYWNRASFDAGAPYWSPAPVSPRCVPGSMRFFLSWGGDKTRNDLGALETSPGVFNWNISQYYQGSPTIVKRAMAVICQEFGLPFILSAGCGNPPAFYTAYPNGGPVDLSKYTQYVLAMLEEFVPLGMFALECTNEPEAGNNWWGDLGASPGSNTAGTNTTTDATADRRRAFRYLAKVFRAARSAVNTYNTAHSANIQLWATGYQSVFNDAPIGLDPGYTQHYGAGCLDGDDGNSGIGIDNLDAISFHAYNGLTPEKLPHTIMEIHNWSRKLGRPGIPVVMSEGTGDTHYTFKKGAMTLDARCRMFLGFFACMSAYSGGGCFWYAWDEANYGFYGDTGYTIDYLTLETKYAALKSLLTTGGNKVFSLRLRNSDALVQILVGATRGAATWYAMDSTFTGA